jgi:DNA-binding MarR family transcriptional regulator
MKTSAVSKLSPLDIQRSYRDNFARHILSVTLHLQSEVMNALTIKHGHSQLRINFEPYISISAAHGARLSDIAEQLGISRQAANQTVNLIETAGYLHRRADPSDGRAKILVTTPRAETLIRQGAREAGKIEEQLAKIIGIERLTEASNSLVSLNRELGLLFPFENTDAKRYFPLSALLPRLSDYITNRLQQLTIQKGHLDLKKSFGQVLSAIGPSGGRIQQMANAHDISKQAISSIALELENLGYIQRHPNPEDARQVVLKFTDRGMQLIADSVASIDELALEFTGHLGPGKFEAVRDVMACIYRSLHLEEDIFRQANDSDPLVLARQLYRQLGEDGAKALGHLLISGETNF